MRSVGQSLLEDPRKRVLLQLLAIGALGIGPAQRTFAQALLGGRPAALTPGQSIYRISGSASVNGAVASLQTPVAAGDTVETGDGSEIIFVVGTQSMILRGNSRLTIERAADTALSSIIGGLRLLTGRLLSVSRGSRMQLRTQTATVGIRGTGWYAEADPEQTYFCTCYGTADIEAANDPQSRETVTAKQHDRPLYIVAGGQSGQNIRNAPFINHTDQELALIEALVGREPPFTFPRDDYTGPRREY